MTNAEKYKTADERAAAFDKYCDIRCRSDYRCSVAGCKKCLLDWLDREAEVEKPMPCPFCGGKVSARVYWNGKKFYKCVNENCLYSSALKTCEEEAIAAHNRVFKAVKNSEVTK